MYLERIFFKIIFINWLGCLFNFKIPSVDLLECLTKKKHLKYNFLGYTFTTKTYSIEIPNYQQVYLGQCSDLGPGSCIITTS